VSGSADSIGDRTAYPGPVRVIRNRRPLLRILLGAWFVTVAAITLTPTPAADEQFGPVRAVLLWLNAHGIDATYLGVEFTANVLMFIPFGVLAGLLLPRRLWWLVLTGGTCVSVAIELAQLLFLPTRVADLRDVLANSLGAAIGLGVVVAARPARTAPQELVSSTEGPS
jgi:hypothetical protein